MKDAFSDDSPEVLEVTTIIESLIRVACERGYVVAGFLFGFGKTGRPEDQLMVNFSNCTDGGSEELFRELCRNARAWKAERRAVTRIVGPVQ